MILFTNLKFKNYIAIAIFPFVFIHKNYKGNTVIINHEKIHLRQQIELWWIVFFVWYLIEFLIKLIKYKNWDNAYKNISFEKEAYLNEDKLEYLKRKKYLSFIKYL